jgi:coatomer subunit beta'
VPKAVAAWKASLVASNKKKSAEAIADPTDNADLFEEGWTDALARETGKQRFVAD